MIDARSRYIENVVPLTAIQDRRAQACFQEESIESALDRDKENRESLIRKVEVLIARGHFQRAINAINEYKEDYEERFVKSIDMNSHPNTLLDDRTANLLHNAGYVTLRSIADAPVRELLAVPNINMATLKIVVKIFNRHKITLGRFLSEWAKTESTVEESLQQQMRRGKKKRRL